MQYFYSIASFIVSLAPLKHLKVHSCMQVVCQCRQMDREANATRSFERDRKQVSIEVKRRKSMGGSN